MHTYVIYVLISKMHTYVRLCFYQTQSAQLRVGREGSPRRREVGGEVEEGRASEEGSLRTETFPDWVCFPLAAVLSPSVLRNVRSPLMGSSGSFSIFKNTSVHAQV